MVVSGSIVVPSGTGNGTLSIEVKDLENFPLTTVTFSNEGLANSTTIPNVGSMVLLYQGSPVSPANPLPIGATAEGSLQVTNVTGGVNYEISVQGTFQNGASSFQTMSMTAQY
jgi:hypothetical protein